jgi:hypothetical protein
MKNNLTLRWTLANSLGMSLGFLASQQFLMFYDHGLNFEMHWVFGADIDMSENAILLGKGIGLAIFGSVFSLGQALILKQYLPKIWAWVLNGALGYIVVVLIMWPLIGIWGSIPGPVEPLTIVLGGTLFMLILQWSYLRKRGIKPARPILWFAAGALLGVVPLFLLFYFILGDIPWALEICIMGLIIGGCAGFLSAKHFQKILEERSM